MSVKEEWVKEGLEDEEELSVLTPRGKGKIVSLNSAGVFRVEIEKPKLGKRVYRFENGEVTPHTDFTLVRIVNLGFLREKLLTVAQNYLSWEECLEELDQPYSQDTTLIAFDFQDKEVATNRAIPQRYRYHLIESCFDRHYLIKENIFFDSLQEAKKGWKKIEKLAGTTGHILFCTLLDVRESKILSRAVFTTLQVITKETWW
ncbi:hypothetical protein KAU51_02485 [Candidatus Parcubacteria bacterium]|nr:hypothetical protein [Candidatus Parcubacteria bacterium]